MMPRQALLSALLLLALLPGTTSLPPLALHPAPRLTLRGGIDIKWTPSSDEPIAPFSKKARDAQAEREGRNPSAAPPEPWSIPRGLRAIANTVMEHPKETAYLFCAATVGYCIAKIRAKLQWGWPVPLRSTSPHLTLLRPHGRYLKQELLPKMRIAQWNHAMQGMTQKPVAKGYKEVRHRVQVGEGADDWALALQALRTWRIVDAVDWLSAHSTPDDKEGESVVLVARTSLGYLASPWRVSYREEDAADVASKSGADAAASKSGADAAAAKPLLVSDAAGKRKAALVAAVAAKPKEVGDAKAADGGKEDGGATAEKLAGTALNATSLEHGDKKANGASESGETGVKKGEGESAKASAKAEEAGGERRGAVGLSSLKGNNFEGEVRLEVSRDTGGVVWFEVVSYTRAAKGSALGTSGYLQRLHRKGLSGMAGAMAGIIRQEREMRAARAARQSVTSEVCHEAAAAIAGRKLQQQRDKENFEKKEWTRNNSGKGST